MCQSYSGIYSCRHFVITTEHCGSCPPQQRVYSCQCLQPNPPISRDRNPMCDKCDEKEKWSIGRSSTGAMAEPSRPRVSRSQTAAPNGTFSARVIPRLMPRLRRTQTNIYNYPTAINRRETGRNLAIVDSAVDQQTYKCEKHTDFATNSFAMRCYDQCRRIFSRVDRPCARHIGVDVDSEVRRGCGVCGALRREREEVFRGISCED